MSSDFETQLKPVLPVAYRAALHLARTEDDAQDLLQDAAIQAFRRFETFEDGTHFRAWFLKILLRVHLNKEREKQRRPAIENRDFEDEIEQNFLFHRAREAFGGDPAKTYLQKITAQEIHRALAELPTEFRACAVLYFLEQMSYDAIAVALDCPINTVRSRLHRARKLLQRELWMLSGNGATPPPDAANHAAKTRSKRARNADFALKCELFWLRWQPKIEQFAAPKLARSAAR